MQTQLERTQGPGEEEATQPLTWDPGAQLTPQRASAPQGTHAIPTRPQPRSPASPTGRISDTELHGAPLTVLVLNMNCQSFRKP